MNANIKSCPTWHDVLVTSKSEVSIIKSLLFHDLQRENLSGLSGSCKLFGPISCLPKYRQPPVPAVSLNDRRPRFRFGDL